MQKRMLVIAVGLVALLLTGCIGLSPAKLSVSPLALDFGIDETELKVLISNSGKKELVWRVSVAGEEAWLTVEPTEGTNEAEIVVVVEREGLEAGTYSADLEITSNGGSQTVPVLMKIEKAPSVVPEQVRNLDVRGFTMPVDLKPLNSFGLSALELRALIEKADELFARERCWAWEGGNAEIRPGNLPAGYKALFVLSWDPVPNCLSYCLFKRDGGIYKKVKDIGLDDLEDPAQPTYIFEGDFKVGDLASFRVQAANEAGVGEASEEDSGVIIAVQELLTPADGSTAPERPRFVWKEHLQSSGYLLTVAQGELGNHLWQQVLVRETEVRYPGDDPEREPLAAGEYLWYVLTQGPVGTVAADAYSLSKDWVFVVE